MAVALRPENGDEYGISLEEEKLMGQMFDGLPTPPLAQPPLTKSTTIPSLLTASRQSPGVQESQHDVGNEATLLSGHKSGGSLLLPEDRRLPERLPQDTEVVSYPDCEYCGGTKH